MSTPKRRRAPYTRRWMTMQEVATYSGMNPRTIRRWVAAGKLPAHRIGPRELRFDLDDVEALVTPVPVVKMIPAMQTRARRSTRRSVD